MPLIYEARQGGNDWRQVGPALVAGGIGSISHIGSDGAPEIIIFRCNGETSTIELARKGTLAVKDGPWRLAVSPGFDVIATLADGEEFTMPLRNKLMGHYNARWRHEKESK